MPSVNLIPRKLLLQRGKIRRVRMWLMIGGACWIFASIPVIRELSAEYQLNSQSTALTAISDQLDHAHARRGQSAKRLLMLRQEVARADKLRYKRLWTDMISVIADATPQRVWLIQLSTDPAKPPVSARTTAPLSLRRSANDDGNFMPRPTPPHSGSACSIRASTERSASPSVSSRDSGVAPPPSISPTRRCSS